MFVSGREAHSEILPGLTRFLGVVWRPTWMSRSGLEELPEVR